MRKLLEIGVVARFAVAITAFVVGVMWFFVDGASPRFLVATVCVFLIGTICWIWEGACVYRSHLKEWREYKASNFSPSADKPPRYFAAHLVVVGLGFLGSLFSGCGSWSFLGQWWISGKPLLGSSEYYVHHAMPAFVQMAGILALFLVAALTRLWIRLTKGPAIPE